MKPALAAAAIFGAVALLRFVWNVAEEGLYAYGYFEGFWLLDRSTGFFQVCALFLIVAGVWRQR